MIRAALLLALAACTLRPLAPPDAGCTGTCVADPIAHCIADGVACTTDDDCTSGLNCASHDPSVPCATADDQVRQCRPRHSQRERLTDGFGVAGMQIDYEPAVPSPAIRWHAPAAAKSVACALFSCDPAIAGEPGHQQIANFDTCAVLFRIALVEESVFRLDEDNAYVGFEQRCTAPAPTERVFNELVAACWAYDEFHLVAASDLVAIPPDALRGFPSLPRDAACASDGDACYDAATETFGVCAGASCTAHCRSAADCGAWALRTGAAKPGDACAWECRGAACVPRG